MIEEVYNSPVRKNRVMKLLINLIVRNFVSEKEDRSKALEKVYRLILKLSRQVPLSHRGDAHRTEFLRKAVIGYGWSREQLSSIATNGLTFQNLYGELESVVQLDRESRVATEKDKVNNLIQNDDDDAVTIKYTGQGRYSKSRPKSQFNHGEKNHLSGPLSLMGCFNCEQPDHMAKKLSPAQSIGQSGDQEALVSQEKEGTALCAHFVRLSMP